ncbi:M23 family metallopeptidase [Saliterribacillus persicus]|uniref:Murein DD-endopeptidase MepM/ murein hydrolase activator NlpD n=1 Tax=Saliterribacillus persicus TaxID=930114 RepID=A0A368XC01_9BACI|nr:M23 family metallopeptidase [Saliterribacillus persicus]RCW64528.1 murein DD-endopeptidase MepM/ murein hydrolase activator NlpD [Saliterribacillus persicus]
MKQSNRRKNNLVGYLKRVTLASILGLALTTQVAYADDLNLSTIFHVYVDGEHIGVVDDQQLVESHVENLINQKEAEKEGYNYVVNENVKYVSEKVFQPNAKNTETMEYLEDELTLSVDAQAVMIGDAKLGYFANEEAAQQVLQAYKEKFVNKDILTKLENEEETGQKLQVGDSVIIDVSLTEEVTYEAEKVKEDEILSLEQGLKLLEDGTLEDKKYKVKEGDVLGSIASAYDLSKEELLNLNEDLTEDSYLQIGQELNVVQKKPFVEVVVLEEKLEEETIEFETETVEDKDMYKGDKEVTQEGKDGKAEVQFSVKKVNGKVVSEGKVEETITAEPVKEIVKKGTKVVPSQGSGQFQWPAVGGYISSHVGPRWGSQHNGIDIAGVSNRSILAADHGVVRSAGWHNGGYGNQIVIDHNNGYRSSYSHLASISVSAGQSVERGQKIGVMGTTGRSTGIHLHFEIYKNGALQNPANLVR